MAAAAWTVRKIVEHLARHGIDWPGGYENAVVQRTHAGRWQKSRGAWLWRLAIKNTSRDMVPQVGSLYTAVEIAKAKNVEVYSADHRGYELSPAE